MSTPLAPPPCPRCGLTTGAIISRSESAVLGPAPQGLEVRYVFKCPCGLAFTHTVKPEPEDPAGR